MNIIELHRDFSERYPYARSSELLFHGERPHHDLAEKIKELYPETELFINKD